MRRAAVRSSTWLDLDVSIIVGSARNDNCLPVWKWPHAVNPLKLDHTLSFAVPVKDPDVIVVDYVEAFDGSNMAKVFNHVALDECGNVADIS